MTSPGDIYLRTAWGDHVMILKVKAFPNDVYQYRWLELETGRFGTYTNPHGDDITSCAPFVKVA